MTAPLTDAEADTFVASWIAAWNSHDVDAIVDHYRDDIEYHSPFVAQLAGEAALRGKDAVRDYVAAALDRFPDLHFDPPSVVAVGASSVSMVYRSVNDLTAVETRLLDDDHVVTHASHCHYRALA